MKKITAICLIVFMAGSLWAQIATGADRSVFEESKIDIILYVDPVKGNDKARGTSAKPFKTANRALKVARMLINVKDKGVKVILKPGIYHEQIRMFYIGRYKFGQNQVEEYKGQTGTYGPMLYKMFSHYLGKGQPKNTLKPLVIEAEKTGTAIFDSTEKYTDWEKERGGIYSHTWEHDFDVYTEKVQGGHLTNLGRR
ncbi:MAG TPA: hypothetical protein VKS21_05180, partial [Spirochaetota bacterium]|nr:hypothetical protein [Spirochaetota bacterium]